MIISLMDTKNDMLAYKYVQCTFVFILNLNKTIAIIQLAPFLGCFANKGDTGQRA